MGAHIYAQRERLGKVVQEPTMRARIGQMAWLRVDPKKSFKTKILRGFARHSDKIHLVEKKGGTNLRIFESWIYPKMLQKINLLGGFCEDLAKNFVYENKGVIRMGGAEEKGEPHKIVSKAGMLMKTKGQKNGDGEYPKILLKTSKLSVVTQYVYEKKGT